MPRGRLRLRRVGEHSLVHFGADEESGRAHEMTVQARLNDMGFGIYQVIVTLAIGVTLFAECLEMGAVSPLHTAMSRFYHLSDWERISLPSVTFAGSAIGLLVSGPICDWRGRLPSLYLSLVTIAVVMLVTSVLPQGTHPGVILTLRFLSGFAASIQVPAGMVLAVESCPEDSRPFVVFGINLIGQLGYLLEAVGVLVFMPEFGESDSDAWRSFCLFIGATALVALPPTLILMESPSFLAMKGDVDGCIGVLDHIATVNGRRPLKEKSRVAKQQVPPRGLCDVLGVFSDLDGYHWLLFIVLAGADCLRGFFVSGSSYLWKDLFQLSGDGALPPATMNIVASVMPLIGLLISQRLLFLGVRRVAFVSASVACFSLACLANPGTRETPWAVLACICSTKLTYGPLGACISLMKAESFPTEIRASSYALISVIAKLSNMLAPTLIEALRGSEAAASWTPERLSTYVLGLSIAGLVCGLLIFLVPGSSGDGDRLHDFFEKKIGTPRVTLSDSALVADYASSEGEFGEFGPGPPSIAPRCHSVPNKLSSLGGRGTSPSGGAGTPPTSNWAPLSSLARKHVKSIGAGARRVTDAPEDMS